MTSTRKHKSVVPRKKKRTVFESDDDDDKENILTLCKEALKGDPLDIGRAAPAFRKSYRNRTKNIKGIIENNNPFTLTAGNVIVDT